MRSLRWWTLFQRGDFVASDGDKIATVDGPDRVPEGPVAIWSGVARSLDRPGKPAYSHRQPVVEEVDERLAPTPIWHNDCLSIKSGIIIRADLISMILESDIIDRVVTYVRHPVFDGSDRVMEGVLEDLRSRAEAR